MRQTNKNDRATRGASACAARAIPQIINHPRKIGISAPLRQSSIDNHQSTNHQSTIINPQIINQQSSI